MLLDHGTGVSVSVYPTLPLHSRVYVGQQNGSGGIWAMKERSQQSSATTGLAW